MSEKPIFSRERRKVLPDEVRRDDGEREQDHREQEPRLKRDGAEEFPAPVDHQKLDRRDQGDQGEEKSVAEDPGKQPEAFGAGVDAVEKPRENEQNEESGKIRAGVGGVAENAAEDGKNEKADREQERIAAGHGDLSLHIGI